VGRRKSKPENTSPQVTLIPKEELPMLLDKGFYIVDGSGQVRTKFSRRKGEDGKFVEVEEPIRARTIKSALDILSCCQDSAVLCVTEDNFAWGE
jgi:hypothetical protein